MSRINKRTVLVLFLGVLLIGWMILIFAFSCEDGETSGKTSTDKITSIFDIIISSKLAEQIKAVVEQNQHLIRKTAHFLAYAVLGFLAAAFLSAIGNINGKSKFTLSFVFCYFYAATDELHQCFVLGRSGALADIFLDAVGAVTAIIAFVVIENMYKHAHRTNKPIP